jgi:uncharacterized damage-inducible protein DinB
MNRQAHLQTWDMMRLRHGVGLRLLEAMSYAQLTATPIPGMRSAKELAVHMYGSIVRSLAEGPMTGVAAGVDEKAITESLASKEALIAYVKECWAAAHAAALAVTDAQLAGVVKPYWGGEYPAFMMYVVIADEYLHHRGQLYCFARAQGIEPPMNWDFEHSAPEFQMQAHG